MEYEAIVQTVLEEIDRRITETICAEDLARTAGYSLYHFCRIFMNLTGMPVKGYILRRKLEFALYDLMRGEKILDVAMCYGFETHVGFTKAFKKRFGCPPSLYRLHVMASPPTRATIESIKRGGTCMQVEIKGKAPFTWPDIHRGIVSRESAVFPIFRLFGTNGRWRSPKDFRHCTNTTPKVRISKPVFALIWRTSGTASPIWSVWEWGKRMVKPHSFRAFIIM